jgi:hypothetical protein
MPREITSDAVFVDTLAVPRDGEAIDAKDVAIPFQDLLGNTQALYGLYAGLNDKLDALIRLNAGFTITAPPSLALEPSRTYVLTDGIGLGRVLNYTQNVTLTALNLPVGVTASFSPSTLSGATITSTLTLTVASNAIAGPYDITIRGTGADGKVSEALVKVVVAAQTAASSFIFTTANSISVGQDVGNHTATTNISIERQGGFSSPIAFSVTGLPAGVQPTFTPTPVTGSDAFTKVGTALTVTTTGTSTPAGAYSMNIRAEGGGVVRTYAMALYVAPPTLVTPDFDLSVAYDNGDALVINGATITINRKNGFTGPVTLSLPKVTGTFGTVAADYFTPRLLINGQPGSVVITGNTARITTDGTSTGWANSGVAPVLASASDQFRRATVTGTADLGTSGTLTRYADVTYRTGTRRY